MFLGVGWGWVGRVNHHVNVKCILRDAVDVTLMQLLRSTWCYYAPTYVNYLVSMTHLMLDYELDYVTSKMHLMLCYQLDHIAGTCNLGMVTPYGCLTMAHI